MTTADLEKLVLADPNVKLAAQSVAAAKGKVDAAAAAKDAAYSYWQEKKSSYEGTASYLFGLKEQRRLLANYAERDYNAKVGAWQSAVAEYNSADAIYKKVVETTNARIVEQANAASAAEIEASKAAAAKSNTATVANTTKAVQATTQLEAEKAKRQKFLLIGGIVFVVFIILGIVIYKRYSK